MSGTKRRGMRSLAGPSRVFDFPQRVWSQVMQTLLEASWAGTWQEVA